MDRAILCVRRPRQFGDRCAETKPWRPLDMDLFLAARFDDDPEMLTRESVTELLLASWLCAPGSELSAQTHYCPQSDRAALGHRRNVA